MKRILSLLLAAVILLTLAACGSANNTTAEETGTEKPVTETYDDAIRITLSDGMTEVPEGVTLSGNIVYYEAGHDFTYGEGTADDEHAAEEAAAHTVVTITEAGKYLLTGKLTAGQIAVDLGEDAEDDPNAVVTLILGGVDITCTVAPAVIFYNVYECGDAGNPTKDVDTSAAGANVIIADGTENTVRGAYVARIYKSVVLSDDGTEVVDSKKLHKYDGAFYSKMSMNVDGGGHLYIYAENEGLDSEMHLTINGGNIYIRSGNDGINTNEDNVSVTTVNGGLLSIIVDGSTGEGDGIDSNGWLVINGGTVIAQACSTSGDAGIDSDMGIYLGGGTVIATGNMLDRIAGGDATYAVFQFARRQKGGEAVALKSADEEVVFGFTPDNDYQYLIVSAPELTAGDYTLWCGDTQMQGISSMTGMGGMQRPEGMESPADFDPTQMQRAEGMEPPADFDPTQMQRPEGMEPPADFDPAQMQRPEGMELPEDFDPDQMGEGHRQRPDDMDGTGEASTVFAIKDGANSFMVM